VNDADRHLERLLQVLAEIVGHGGKLLNRLGIAVGPLRIHVGGRGILFHARHVEQAEPRAVGVLDVVGRAGGLRHGPLHVRLAAGDPHFTHHDIVDLDLVLAGDDKLFGLIRRLERLELHGPLAVAGGGLHLLFAKFDGDFLAVVGPAPHGDGLALLEHHVIGEERGEFDLGPGGGGEGEHGNQGEGGILHGKAKTGRRKRAVVHGGR